ncbi:MAG: M48 family metallopeptidase [Rhodobacter sp.]|nr:M48 family metallopeptidase [Rhodobacter sp.]
MTPAPQIAAVEAYADFLDGDVAVVRRVRLSLDEPAAALVVAPPEAAPQAWPFAEIRQLRDQASGGEVIVHRIGDPVARLILRDPATIRLVEARCPNLHRRPPAQNTGRLAAWAAAALASVALIIFVLVPAMANRLAGFLPPAGERALGDTTLEQIRTALDDTGFRPLPFCTAPAGTAALERMTGRLTAGVALPYPVTVHVLDHDLINAFALPGGYVVFFRGLIEEAETPDEVAAVLAHELGHVVNRDPTRIALRSAGSIGVLGLLLGDFAGGAVVLFLAERLIQATYTQEAEAAADAFAHATLAAAGIPPSALGTMFQRLLEEYGDAEGIVAHFMSHPALGDRIEAARRADAGLTGALRPSLDATDWRALQRICR